MAPVNTTLDLITAMFCLQVVLRLADLFRVRLDIGSRVEATAAVEVLPGVYGNRCRVWYAHFTHPSVLSWKMAVTFVRIPQPPIAEAECKVPAGCRSLLAALAGCPDGGAAPAPELRVAEPTGPKVAALVQAVTARLSRLADLAAELDGLRPAFPALTDVACSAGEGKAWHCIFYVWISFCEVGMVLGPSPAPRTLPA